LEYITKCDRSITAIRPVLRYDSRPVETYPLYGTAATVPSVAGTIPAAVTSIFYNLEFVFASPTFGADPILGQIFKCRSRADTIVWIPIFRIINILAQRTLVLLHGSNFLLSRRCLTGLCLSFVYAPADTACCFSLISLTGLPIDNCTELPLLTLCKIVFLNLTKNATRSRPRSELVQCCRYPASATLPVCRPKGRAHRL